MLCRFRRRLRGLGARRAWDCCRRPQGAGGLRAGFVLGVLIGASARSLIAAHLERCCRGLRLNGQHGRGNQHGGECKRAFMQDKARPLSGHSFIRLCRLSSEVLVKAPSGYRRAHPSS